MIAAGHIIDPNRLWLLGLTIRRSGRAFLFLSDDASASAVGDRDYAGDVAAHGIDEALPVVPTLRNRSYHLRERNVRSKVELFGLDSERVMIAVLMSEQAP
jgi:hypothetical protein